MKRRKLIYILGCYLVLMAVVFSSVGLLPVIAQGDDDDDDDIIINPVNPPDEDERPFLEGGEGADPDLDLPEIDPPPTLDELLEEYPELGAFLDELEGLEIEDYDLETLYAQLVQIYNDHGASGLVAFLEESDLIETLGLPMEYVELLLIYEEEGWEGVEERARELRIINDDDEIVGYLAIEDEHNVEETTAALEELGVSVYKFLINTDELEIGIPLEILLQFQTPDGVLNYLVQIANAPHVTGFRGPVFNEPERPNWQPESEGGARVGLEEWHSAGFTGAGVKVGVLDLGFGGVVDMIRAGELPSNMTANYDGAELNSQDEVHGTACAMVVHRAAPEAELFVAYYDGTYSAFIDALEFLVENEVDIISHSVGSPLGPRDGSWGDSALVTEFVRQTGILWVNAAGNWADEHTIWKYKENEKGWHDFGGSPLLPFLAGVPVTTVIMNWNGSWDGKEDNNYRILILDEEGEEVAVAAESRRGRANDLPAQATRFRTTPGDVYYLAIQRTRGTTNHILDLFVMGGLLPEWGQVSNYSIAVPGDAAASLTVGATGLETDDLEFYSSQGPTNDNRIKPDVTAPTNERLPLPGYEDGFSGTSGATPLVAGVAALIMQRYPEMGQEQVKAYLMDNVLDLGDPGADPLYGSGRISVGESTATDPAAVEPTGDAGAVVTDYSVQFNVRLQGARGMKVSLSFAAVGMQGSELAAVLMFTDQDGNDVAGPNPDYMLGGTLGTYEIFEVPYPVSRFTDVVLFFPNKAFGQQPSGTTLEYSVAILNVTDRDNIEPVWISDPDQITFP